MTNETIDKLMTLIMYECGWCGGEEKVPTSDYLDWQECPRCQGTGRKFFPLALEFDSTLEKAGLLDERLLIYAVEECLGLMGSWEYDFHLTLSLPHGYQMCNLDYGDTYRDINRLTAAVECLWERVINF
jgi:hypothetical protein